MWMSAERTLMRPLLVGCLIIALVPLADAQDIEPRQFANAPTGLNIFLGGPMITRLGLPQDPAIPLEDPRLNTAGGVLGYARVLRVGGQSATLSVVLPYMWLEGEAKFNGEPVTRSVQGFSDAKLRFSVNLLGAPALDLKEYMVYQQDLIVGASLTVTAPTGQYDPERLVNIGAHRWSFKGELGASKVAGKWVLELMASGEVFTNNPYFFGDRLREQDPVFAGKGHVIRNFKKGLWVSVDATYYAGGATTIGGVFRNDLQQNWRLGATLVTPITHRHILKFNFSTGVYARTGNNFDLAAITWQYRWGAGF